MFNDIFFSTKTPELHFDIFVYYLCGCSFSLDRVVKYRSNMKENFNLNHNLNALGLDEGW